MLMKWKIYRIPKILSLTGIITLENIAHTNRPNMQYMHAFDVINMGMAMAI